MEQVLESSETVFIKRMKLGIIDKPNVTETWEEKSMINLDTKILKQIFIKTNYGKKELTVLLALNQFVRWSQNWEQLYFEDI